MYVAQLFAVLALVAQAVALPLDQPTTNLLALAEPVTIPITRKVNLVSPDTVPAGGEANMRAMTTGAIGTQGVLNRANVMYTVNVNIGTPPQTLEVQLDTGSRALGVPYRIAAEDMYQFRGKANTSSMEETCFGNIFGWI
ncbi:hypothetical protein CcaverHIS631_0505100 [Cutaneotrichosporon cavernicola]|nr:hypothetical protein CcaverHIS631_0505100 [Cutaneotrichosporon cavernicola]